MSKRPSVWGTLPENGTVLTTAEYLRTAESVRVQELRHGVLHVRESPAPAHQATLLTLAITLEAHVRRHDLGSVWIAPLDVILDPARALVLQPDLFFVWHERAGIVSDQIEAWGGWELFQELLYTLSEIAKKHDSSIANVSTKFILDKPAVAGVIIGARLGISEHRKDNARVFDLQLDSQDHSMINLITEKSNDLFDVIGDCGDEYR